jgi:hypothetical protein
MSRRQSGRARDVPAGVPFYLGVARLGAQAAEGLGISPTTADRYWAFARAWLQTEVRGR